MKFLTKHFVVGFILGGILSPVVLLGVVLGVSYALRPWIVELRAQQLTAPPVPAETDSLYDWQVMDRNGNGVEFGAFKGQPVFLTVWSGVCSHCISELPVLQSLYEKTRDDELAFVTVAVKGHEQIDPLVKEHGVTFPIYTVASLGDVPAKFRPRSVPTTIVFDAAGEIAFYYVGPARWDDESVVDFLNSLTDDQTQ